MIAVTKFRLIIGQLEKVFCVFCGAKLDANKCKNCGNITKFVDE